MASTYLSRTQTTATDRKKLTLSTWIKRGNLITISGGSFQFFVSSYISASDRIGFYFNSDDSISVFANTSGTTISLQTSRLFKDISAWYHIVYEIDTTQATSSDRVKIYVNGEQETSFQTATYPTQNSDIQFGTSSYNMYVGTYDTSQYYFSGVLAHTHFIDGTAYDADTFGQTDTTTGIWYPKFVPSVTYGANGFFLKFENSSAFGTDSSGNGNTFTVNGTMTQTIDTPSNVFATMNPLNNNNANFTFANGNLQTTSSTQWLGDTSTLAVSKGKWYWEVKYISGNMGFGIGKIGTSATTIGNLSSANNGYVGNYPDGYEYFKNGTNSQKINNNSTSSYGTVASANDILMVAFDADNGTIWVGKNGTWFNSATQTEIENGTTTNAMYSGITIDDYFTPTCSLENATLQFNFGNGYFGTTAVSSAQNPDDGIGIFEYSVPSGYKALCTNSINAQEYS